jgi:hypothetical protein
MPAACWLVKGCLAAPFIYCAHSTRSSLEIVCTPRRRTAGLRCMSDAPLASGLDNVVGRGGGWPTLCTSVRRETAGSTASSSTSRTRRRRTWSASRRCCACGLCVGFVRARFLCSFFFSFPSCYSASSDGRSFGESSARPPSGWLTQRARRVAALSSGGSRR